MNWSDATPWLSLAVSIGGIAFYAGAFYERGKATDKAIADLKHDMKESAKDQGGRIGELETKVDNLEKFEARVEGAERERDLSGVVRR